MKLIVLMSILSLIQAEENLDIYTINGVRYYKEVLFENLCVGFKVRGNSLAVDYTTNDLYVDYHCFGPYVFNINTREVKKYITGIPFPQCITVDQGTHDVFIGTIIGIYKYNGSTGVKELIGARGDNVWRINNYNGVLYYIKYGFGMSQEIIKLVNGKSIKFYEFGDIRNFVIDSEENIVFSTNNGSLHRHKNGAKHGFLYEGIPRVNSLTTDRNGNVYFSVEDGIFEVKRDGVERVLYIDNLRYIAFDSDNNLIYLNITDFKLYRLTPIEKPVEGTNSCLDCHTHVKELDVTKNYSSSKSKIDNLA